MNRCLGNRLRQAALLVIFTCACAGTAAAQALPAEEPAPRPLDLLLERRSELALTGDQLTRLDGIRGRLASENEPLLSRMMSLRAEWRQARRSARGAGGDTTGGDTARVEQIRRDAEDTRAQIQRNNRAAMQDVNRLLTPRQRSQLRTIVQERRQQDEPRRGGGPRANGR